MREPSVRTRSGTRRVVAVAAALLLGATLAPVSPAAAAASESSGEDVVYVQLHPDFIVNLRGASFGHLLLATIEVMSHDAEVRAAVKRHAPAVRNELLLLLSNQTRAQVSSIEGRKKLRREVLAAVNAVLERQDVAGGVEEVYFTNFVVE